MKTYTVNEDISMYARIKRTVTSSEDMNRIIFRLTSTGDISELVQIDLSRQQLTGD